MRKLLTGFVLIGLLASCSQYTCPTYSKVRSPRVFSASAKKSKAPKQSEGYKKVRRAMAEQHMAEME